MRLVFGSDDLDAYAIVRDRLRLHIVAWARRRGMQVEPSLVAAALDHKHSVDGRLGHWTRTHVADALAQGAELQLGGSRIEGQFFQPSVLTGVTMEMAMSSEETFGPVLPVWRVKDLDEAIRLANDTEYGLGASVWTNDIRTIHRIANEVEAGMKWVNQFHYGYDELPFGGVKDSGYGKEHGLEALDSYVELKSVVIGGLA